MSKPTKPTAPGGAKVFPFRLPQPLAPDHARRVARMIQHGSDRVLRPKDAAEYLGVSRSTLYRLVLTEKLAAPRRISARVTGWPVSDLKSYVDSMASPAIGGRVIRTDFPCDLDAAALALEEAEGILDVLTDDAVNLSELSAKLGGLSSCLLIVHARVRSAQVALFGPESYEGKPNDPDRCA